MDAAKVKLVPIGRFSRTTRLSVKALRLYDENGLLRPAYVDPSSGYRYYNLEQANRAEIIRILRSVDMPLEEIRIVVDTEDEALANQTLVRHKERLADQLSVQQRMLTYLESIIQHKERFMPYEINLTDVDPQLIAAVKMRTSLSAIGKSIGQGFGTLMQGLARVGATPAGAPMVLYHDMIDAESEGDIEICVPVASALASDQEVYGRELEGGKMATAVHRGPYEELSAVYQTLTSWISDNSLEVAGPPRETYLNDPQQVSPAELLTRVEFPVCSEHS